MKIYIGSDHAGFELKEALLLFLESEGYEVEDNGAYSYEPDDDYPDFVKPVAQEVARDPENNRGIVLGYSGQAEAITANKTRGIRAVVFYGNKKPLEHDKKAGEPVDLLSATREDNDANVLSLGAGFLNEEEAKSAVRVWLETPFGAEERHVRRISKIESK